MRFLLLMLGIQVSAFSVPRYAFSVERAAFRLIR